MAINVSVHLRRGETTEKLIRRFSRKVKKDRVLETYRERTSYYVKPAVKRKMKSKKARQEKERRERKMNKRR